MNDARVWSYANRERPIGSFTEAEMVQLIERGEINGDTLVWRKGMREWAEARSVDPFAARVAPEEQRRT